MLADAGEHLPRDGVLLEGADEEHDYDFIEGGDEGEERAGDDSRGDQRHDDFEEGVRGFGAEAGSGTDEALVEAAEGGGYCYDDEGRAEGGVREDDAEVGALEVDARIKEEHASRRDDQGHDHGREQDRHDHRAVGHVRAAQAKGGDGAEHGGDDGGEEGDYQAVADGLAPVDVGEEILVPLGGIAGRIEAEHGFGEGEVGYGVEGQRHDHQHREDQEEEDAAANDVKAIVPDFLGERGVGG